MLRSRGMVSNADLKRHIKPLRAWRVAGRSNNHIFL